MTDQLILTLCSKILHFLLLHWWFDVIAEEVHCYFTTVYRFQKNLFMYNFSFKSQFQLKNTSWKIFLIAEDFLITYLKQQSWAMQKEMMWFLWKKWDIHVHRFTIFRILKKKYWSNKKKQHVSVRQNDELCLNWVTNMLRLIIKQLVFMNESLFDEITDWCHQVYASIDESAHYQVSRKKEHFWSVLLTYIINDYLLCIDIREDWFNDETFFQWLADELLSLCSFFSTSRSVIIMNNVSVHCNARIEELIISHECEVWYLSSYSLNFNLIELSFNVLKIWVRKHFKKI